MRHYEIVFLVNPEHSERVPDMIEHHRSIVGSGEGIVHRLEDWGVRQLAYPIDKITKAHYVLMNIECEPEVCEEISSPFRYDDAVIRHLVLRLDQPVSEASPIAQAMAKETEAKAEKTEKAEKNKASGADAAPSQTTTQPVAVEPDKVLVQGEDDTQTQQSKLSE